MPETPARATDLRRAIVEQAIIGDELGRRAEQHRKEAADAQAELTSYKAAAERADATADRLVAAGAFDAEDRGHLVDLLKSAAGPLDVLDGLAAMIIAQRDAPPRLGEPATKTASATVSSRRGPTYGPLPFDERPAVKASNARIDGLIR